MLELRGLTGPFAHSEAIAARDRNNLYLTSCYFADPARYRAFCALYAVMRVVDDRIDSLPSRRLPAAQIQRERAVLSAWRRALFAAIRGTDPRDEDVRACDFVQSRDLLEACATAMRSFPVPLSLWKNFFAAMERDIERPRFGTYQEFLDYSEGAAVAPTTIYLYLIVSKRGTEERYEPPGGFDLIRCGRCLGLFAYIAHTLRDLSLDLSTGEAGLLCLAKDDMIRFGVTETLLFNDLARRRASEPVRALVGDLASRADKLLRGGRVLMQAVEGRLEPDCGFVLELIVTIYEGILAKIKRNSMDPFTGRHKLTESEKILMVQEVALRRGMEGVAPSFISSRPPSSSPPMRRADSGACRPVAASRRR